jgi:hypothetical protein
LPIADLHRDIIKLALDAVRRKGISGVALGGGNALIARADSLRPTRDVDFCCQDPASVGPAALQMAEAIEAAGYRVAQRDDEDKWWEDPEGEMVELIVSTPDDQPTEVEVQVAHFLYTEDSDLEDLGPVLSLDDLGGFKTTCLGNRRMVRDYVDYMVLRRRYSTERLFELAAERDPGLTVEDYADAALYLDGELKDADLAPYLAPGQDAAEVRAAFEDWPRDISRDR